MARTSTIIAIFLASPSDVSAEREIVSRAVMQWNNIYSISRSVIFEIHRWEDTVAAGFGTDGQDVINYQVPAYDVLIALFWTRLGSPTARAISGSLEEYEISLNRRKNGEDIEIAFYFKDSLINPREIDPAQLSLVQEFEKKVQADGAFSKRFSDEDSLNFEINLLLDRMAHRFTATPTATKILNLKNTGGPLAQEPEPYDQSDEDELGLFDVADDLQKHATEATNLLAAMTEKLNGLTETINHVTDEMNDISAVRTIEISDAKPLIKILSDKMNDYSSFVELNLSNYSESSFLMSNDIRKFVNLSYDFATGHPDGIDNLSLLRMMLDQLLVGSTTANKNFLNMRETTSSLQRTTSDFNRSKRRLIAATDSLIEANASIISMTEQSIFELDKLIIRLKSEN